MITLFEDQTQPLSKEEKEKTVPNFIKFLSVKIGKENAVTSAKIIQAYKDKGKEMSGAKVRKVINYIRMNNLIKGLIATSSGYYVSNDYKEIRQYINSLSDRIKAIEAVRNEMENYLKTVKK